MEESGLRDLTLLRARLRRVVAAPPEADFRLPKSAVPVRVPKPLRPVAIAPAAQDFAVHAATPKHKIRPKPVRGLRSSGRVNYRAAFQTPPGFPKLAAQAEDFSLRAKLPSERCLQPVHLRHANLIGQKPEPFTNFHLRTLPADWSAFPQTIRTPQSASPPISTFFPSSNEVPVFRIQARALPLDQPEPEPLDLLPWLLFARMPDVAQPVHLRSAGLALRHRVRVQVPEGLIHDCCPVSGELAPALPSLGHPGLRFPLAAAGPGSFARPHPYAPPGLTNTFAPEMPDTAVLLPASNPLAALLGTAATLATRVEPNVPKALACIPSGPDHSVSTASIPAISSRPAPARPSSAGILPVQVEPQCCFRAALTDQILPLDAPEEYIGIPPRRAPSLDYRPSETSLTSLAVLAPRECNATGLRSLPAEWPQESTVHILALTPLQPSAGPRLGRLEPLSIRFKPRDCAPQLRSKPALEVQGALPLLPRFRFNQPAFSSFRPPVVELPFWNRMPMRAKGLLMAAPLAMVLVTQMVSAPSASPYGSRQGSPLTRAWHGMVDSLSSRAAIDVDEDFHAGLTDWEGSDGTATGWRVDGGSLVPASFAIYRPSASLRDYHIDFSGQIRKKALGWAVRATDKDNYYAIKLIASTRGPDNGTLQKVVVQRFPVIGGVRGQKIETPLQIAASADTIYHVALDIAGDRASLSVQGQVVDSWEFASHARGGVGFFSEKGELASIQGLRINHQTDTLGKLCAWLVR